VGEPEAQRSPLPEQYCAPITETKESSVSQVVGGQQ
jgi:hypothetical protein